MISRLRRIALPSSHTCEWLTALPIYKEWKSGRHHFIWLKGKAGSGKSTLMKQAFQTHASSSTAEAYTVAGYFFDAGGVSLEKSPLGLFRSILHQILSHNRKLLPDFVAIFEKHPVGSKDILQTDLHLLVDLFSELVRSENWTPTFVYLDGLDEGEEKEVRKLLPSLSQLISQCDQQQPKLSMFLSSRHYPNITLQDCPEIVAEDYNGADIAKHLAQNFPSTSLDKEVLVDGVLTKASGVFLWVNLVIEMLQKAEDDGETTSRKRQLLQSAPAELDELYTQLLSRLTASEKEETFQITKWIVFAVRPMTLTEVCFALAMEEGMPGCSLSSWKGSEMFIPTTEQMERLLRSRSRGLLEVKRYETVGYDSEPRSVETIQFIHESVAGYFVRTGFHFLKPSVGRNSSGMIHDQLARHCLRYLEHPEIDDYMESESLWWQLEEQLPFVAYTVFGFFHHVEAAERLSIRQGHLADHFAETGIAALRRRHFCEPRIAGTGSQILAVGWSDFLQIAAARDLESCVEQALRRLQTRASSAKEYDLCHSLYWACEFENTRIAQLLLQSGANPNKAGDLGKTPLHVACTNGNKDLFEVLLQYRADAHCKTIFGWTPLHWAVENGHHHLIDRLLKASALVNTRNMDGETPMAIAARKGFSGILQLLLDNRADYGILDNFNRSALDLAERFGNRDACNILRAAGAFSTPISPTLDSFEPDRRMTASPAPPPTNEFLEYGATGDGRVRALLDTPVHVLPHTTRLTVERRSVHQHCIYCGSKDHKLPKVTGIACPYFERDLADLHYPDGYALRLVKDITDSFYHV
jgi:Ankyrin repeats (3 copies)